jgi:hypothetical protein
MALRVAVAKRTKSHKALQKAVEVHAKLLHIRGTRSTRLADSPMRAMMTSGTSAVQPAE